MTGPKPTAYGGCFPKTQWTEIIGRMQHGDGRRAWSALTHFCEQYRPAICRFFRRNGCSPDEAEDLTQEFFASRILEQWQRRDGFIQRLRRDKCRCFRSFLCHVLWQFLRDKRREKQIQRFGGGTKHVPLHSLEPDEKEVSLQTFVDFGREFDRAFALEMVHRATECSRHAEYLEAHLRGEISQRHAAGKLGISENAFKQSHWRFRDRLALNLRTEVAKFAGPDEVEIRAEIRYLMSLFAESPTGSGAIVS